LASISGLEINCVSQIAPSTAARNSLAGRCEDFSRDRR
jgi:hypothetical protein